MPGQPSVRAGAANVALGLLLFLELCSPATAARALGRQLAATPAADVEPSFCTSWFGSYTNVTVLMVADPGDYSGLGEDAFIASLLEDIATVPAEQTMCAKLQRGTLLGFPVLSATTGIGDVAAAICTTSLLSCASRMKELIFYGTSGWSAQKGGVLNVAADDEEQCGGANPSPEVVRIGDLCVTPLAVDADCRKATWEEQCTGMPDVCTLPGQAIPPDTPALFGQCFFPNAPAESLALAQELAEAARAAAYPNPDPSISGYMRQYWATMTNGTGVEYALEEGGALPPPSVYGPEACAEIDSNFFYAGVPYEMEARTTVAQLISQASGLNLTRQDVIAVSAMEGEGLAYAMQRYLSTNPARPIPFTSLRAASNYLHQPVQQAGAGAWQVAEAAPAGVESKGYQHAIATSSTALLHFLRARCLRAGGSDQACAVPTLQEN